MAWFKKSKKLIASKKTEVNSIKIIAQKDATKKVVEDAKFATKKLNDMLERNYFTIEIFLATGGTIQKQTRNGIK